MKPVSDPLVHFLVIGGILFAVLSAIGDSPDEPADSILITAEQVAGLGRSASLLQGREPTEAELERLVEQAIRDEVYYRRALALGLDIDDDEVRRRLIEKMGYLTENIADPEPAEGELETWFEANAEMFRIPELASFEQVFFSPRMRGDTVETDARAALDALRGGADAADFGDSTPLDDRFDEADPDRVRILFGDELTEAVFSEEPGAWLGPFESDFGLHLVRIASRSAPRDPAYDEVEARVREVFGAQRRAAANEAAFAEMRSYFDIAVQWDPDSDPEDWP